MLKVLLVFIVAICLLSAMISNGHDNAIYVRIVERHSMIFWHMVIQTHVSLAEEKQHKMLKFICIYESAYWMAS